MNTDIQTSGAFTSGPPVEPTIDKTTATPEVKQSTAPLFCYWDILRDVLLILILTFVGGYLISCVALPVFKRPVFAIAASHFLLGTVGFTISGCLAKSRRWTYLANVAVFVWIAGVVNVIFAHVTLMHWFASFFAVASMMIAGGAISFLFKRNTEA